jgi:hypothetical protein
MSTTRTDKNDSPELLADCGPWSYSQDGETHCWTHPTGAVVEVREVAAMRRGPHGEVPTGYIAHVRPAADAAVAEHIVDDGGHLPSRCDCVRAARGWMDCHADGLSR